MQVSRLFGVLVLLAVAQAAHIVALRNALRKIQHTAVAFTDTMVTAHGNIAECRDLLIGATSLLPSLYKGAVMEVNGKLIIRGFLDLHLKDQLRRLREERLAQTLQAIRLALFHKISALRKAAALDGIAAEILGIQAPLLRLIAKQVQPEGPVLQLRANRLQKTIFVLGFVFHIAHCTFSFTKSL